LVRNGNNFSHGVCYQNLEINIKQIQVHFWQEPSFFEMTLLYKSSGFLQLSVNSPKLRSLILVESCQTLVCNALFLILVSIVFATSNKSHKPKTNPMESIGLLEETLPQGAKKRGLLGPRYLFFLV
jgi:hypothetical protein